MAAARVARIEIRPGRCCGAADPGAEVDVPPASAQVGGVGLGDGDEVDHAGVRDECSAATPRPRRLDRGDLLAPSRRRPRRRSLARASPARQAVPARPRRRRPPASRSARTGPRARRNRRRARARPRRRAAPSASRARSRCPRGRRRWSGRSGGWPIRSSPSSTQSRAPGRRLSSSRATARPRMPPPTTARSHSRGGLGVGVTLDLDGSRRAQTRARRRGSGVRNALLFSSTRSAAFRSLQSIAAAYSCAKSRTRIKGLGSPLCVRAPAAPAGSRRGRTSRDHDTLLRRRRSARRSSEPGRRGRCRR